MCGPITTKYYTESINTEQTDWDTLLHPCRGRRVSRQQTLIPANAHTHIQTHHKFVTVADNGERHVYNEVDCCPCPCTLSTPVRGFSAVVEGMCSIASAFLVISLSIEY